MESIRECSKGKDEFVETFDMQIVMRFVMSAMIKHRLSWSLNFLEQFH